MKGILHQLIMVIKIEFSNTYKFLVLHSYSFSVQKGMESVNNEPRASSVFPPHISKALIAFSLEKPADIIC